MLLIQRSVNARSRRISGPSSRTLGGELIADCLPIGFRALLRFTTVCLPSALELWQIAMGRLPLRDVTGDFRRGGIEKEVQGIWKTK